MNLATNAAGALTSTGAQVVDARSTPTRTRAGSSRPTVHPRQQREHRPGDRHRAAARAGQPVRFPHQRDERPRGARAVRVLRDADRQAARRLGRRRLPVLPAARPRVGDAADVPGDRRAAAAQLRDGQRDAEARRQPRHLHPAVVEPGRRALLDAQLRRAAAQPDQPLHHRRQGNRRPVRGQLLDGQGQPRDAASRTRRSIRPRATRGARTSTATTPSARSSTATSARRTRATATSTPGPSEASEPEIKNEHWIADTFDNIKFSNNIHSFGGYFMWAPGAYLTDRGEGALDHANIGVEKYFFAAGDRILDRIKEHRNTAILPERTDRSRTSCARRPATAPTSTGTSATSSPTRSRRAPTCSS